MRTQRHSAADSGVGLFLSCPGMAATAGEVCEKLYR